MGKKIKVDMTGVESYAKASEGQHIAKIASADMKASQGGNDMVVCVFEVLKGNDKGCRVFDNFPLTDTALWKLKGALTAVGIKADGKIVLDLDKLVGKTCIIEVFHEEYNGQMRAKISEYKKLDVSSDDDYEDDEDDDEEEAPAPKKKAAPSPAAKKPTPKPKKVEEDEDEDEEDDWEDDEEEEVKPAPKKKAPAKPEPKAAPKKPAKKKPETEPEDDEDDDDDWEEA